MLFRESAPQFEKMVYLSGVRPIGLCRRCRNCSTSNAENNENLKEPRRSSSGCADIVHYVCVNISPGSGQSTPVKEGGRQVCCFQNEGFLLVRALQCCHVTRLEKGELPKWWGISSLGA